MSKIWIILLICSSLFGKNVSIFQYEKVFKLNKDDIATISVIKKDYKTQSELDGKLKLRWTLFKNDILVLLVNYEGFATQHVLQKIYKRDTISVSLMGDYERVQARVFLVLKFSDYDEKKKIVTIEAKIRDPKNRVEITFIDPKREKR